MDTELSYVCRRIFFPFLFPILKAWHLLLFDDRNTVGGAAAPDHIGISQLSSKQGVLRKFIPIHISYEDFLWEWRADFGYVLQELKFGG
jgi:hypothetical protein